MAIHLVCPSCGKKLKAEEALAGSSQTCVYCQKPFVVPELTFEQEAVVLLKDINATLKIASVRLGWLMVAAVALLVGSLIAIVQR